MNQSIHKVADNLAKESKKHLGKLRERNHQGIHSADVIDMLPNDPQDDGLKETARKMGMAAAITIKTDGICPSCLEKGRSFPNEISRKVLELFHYPLCMECKVKMTNAKIDILGYCWGLYRKYFGEKKIEEVLEEAIA
jgi:hypothetical protein